MIFRKLKLKIKYHVKILKKDIGTLYFAYKNDDTPIIAKLVAVIVVAYALSPIDLIPDFIPVLGYLDDMVLLPLGIAFAIRLIPNKIMDISRIKSDKYFSESKKSNWIVGILIIAIWITLIVLLVIQSKSVINLSLRSSLALTAC